MYYDLKINQINEISYQSSDEVAQVQNINALVQESDIIQHQQRESNHNDFAIQSLIRHSFSNLGPGMAVGDINADGYEDLFVGGAYGQKSSIYFQNADASFFHFEIEGTELYEDQGALIFDSNQDGLLDIYVTSGGSERYANHKAYQDRLYINKGGAKFELGQLPEFRTSTSSVAGGDFDADGDLDLFVGGRLIPSKFPKAATSYVLENRDGIFVDVSEQFSPSLKEFGLVTSSLWTDYNNDHFLDLIVVGEFMPITIFKGHGSVDSFETIKVEHSSGLWNSLVSADFDSDGDLDYVIGNIGTNNHYKASITHPLELNYADFDRNGSVDLIYSQYEEGAYYPMALLDELSAQLPILKKKFMRYNKFARTTTDELLGYFEDIKVSTIDAKRLATIYVENLGDDRFKLSELPVEVQFSSVYGILAEDVNADGHTDLVLVGNTFDREVKYGSIDASHGSILINDGRGRFNYQYNRTTGFTVRGEGRSIVKLNKGNQTYLIVGRNNEKLASFEMINQGTPFYFTKEEKSALVTHKDGSIKKHELHAGSGFLSQSSSSILLTEKVKEVTTYNQSGTVIRHIKNPLTAR